MWNMKTLVLDGIEDNQRKLFGLPTLAKQYTPSSKGGITRHYVHLTTTTQKTIPIIMNGYNAMLPWIPKLYNDSL